MKQSLMRMCRGRTVLLTACFVVFGFAAGKARTQADWLVPQGGEFWRQPDASANSAGLNFSEVVERVSHALRQTAEESFETAAASYSLRVDSDGVCFVPMRPDGLCAQQPEADVFARIQTRLIQAGNSPLYQAGAGRLERVVMGNTAQTRLGDDGALVEHIQALAQGVEVSWVLARKPAAGGGLKIEWALDGLKSMPDAPGHFADASGPARVKVGKAVAADKNRNSWQLATHYGPDGVMKLEVPEFVLQQADYPLAIDPLLIAEFGVDRPVYTNAPGMQRAPIIVWNDDQYLAVWNDTRNGAADIWCARADENGQILDPAGVPVATNPATIKSEIAVAWGGTNWLVVWTDNNNDTNKIYCARVTENTDVLDPEGLVVCSTGTNQQAPSVSWGGTNWLVVWHEFRVNSIYPYIYGMRVTPDGDMLDGAGLAIAGDLYETHARPAVAWGGTNWLVAWQWYDSGYRIRGCRISQDGDVLDNDGVGPGFWIYHGGGIGWNDCPRVSWGATNWLVAWVDGNLDPEQSNISAMRVSETGGVFGAKITVCNASGLQTNASIVWGSTNWLVAWTDYRADQTNPEVYAGRVDEAGTVLDGNGFIPFASQGGSRSEPCVAGGNTNWFVAWSDTRNARYAVYAGRIAWDTGALDGSGLLLSAAANDQSAPAIAWGHTGWLVVWTDSRNGNKDIYAARVDAQTNLLDPAGIAVCVQANEQGQAAAAWGGTNWLVVWSDNRQGNWDIYGARLDASGHVVDPDGQALVAAAGNQIAPALGWGGTDWFVAWEDYRNGPTPRVYGARVSQGLLSLDGTGQALCSQASDQKNPAVAWGHTNWLAVWEDGRVGVNDADIYATRITPSGSVLDGAGLALCTETDMQTRPAVAWGHTNWLAAWSDLRNGTDLNIFGNRITTAGATLDDQGFVICNETTDQDNLALSWNQTNWFAVWRDMRDAEGAKIFGGRVAYDGERLDGNGAELGGPGGGDMTPDVVFGESGRALVAWSQHMAAPFNSERSRSMFWDESYVSNQLIVLGTNGAPIACDSLPSPATGNDFGVMDIGNAPVTNVFTLTNSGDLFLDITEVTLSGPGAARFQIGQIPNTLQAQEAADFKVVFDPAELGEQNAVLSLANTTAITPYLLNLRATVQKRAQFITFPAIADQTAVADVGLSATASSGLPVGFAVVSGPGRIIGGTNLGFTGAGVVKVRASQAGNEIYEAAPALTNSLVVGKADQSITFPALANQTANAIVELSAAASSGLPVEFEVVSGPGLISGGVNLSFTGTGTVQVAASQAGNEIYEAAPIITRSLEVAKATQTIAFAALPVQRVTSRVELSAAASSGLPVEFAVVSGPGLISGGVNLSFTGTGTVQVAASQAGNAIYEAAQDVVRSIGVTGPWGGGAHPGDYDGDARGDLVVFDANTGYWYIRKVSGELIAWAEAWGLPGAWPVAGDYDGDGKYDLAVFDTNNGYWYIRAVSGELIAWAEPWGCPGAWPVGGDYDGDARGDLAVFDTNNGYWYIRAVSGELIAWAEAWGWPGARPVGGDYDGDARGDLAVFDTNNGYWYIRAVSGELIAWAEPWGWPGAWPVAGDYDGDGKYDLAVFDTNNGYWYIRAVSGELIAWAEPWGWPGARPVAGDYDGDGKFDLAVFDVNTGHWYIRAVSGELIAWAEPWGLPGAWPMSASAW